MQCKLAGAIAAVALAACAQAQPPVANARAAITDTEPDVTRQVQSILTQAAQGTLAPDMLTANARTALPPARLQAMSDALKKCGAPPALELLDRQTKGEERQYLYRAPCGGQALLVEINFGKGSRVNRLQLVPQ